MDDMLLFADDRDTLEGARAAIAAWLAEHRGLQLKDPEAPVRSTRERVDWLGYRVHPSGIRAAPKLQRRMRRRLQAAAEQGPEAFERSLQAYRGLLLFR